jgi:hypothetical protein
VLYLVLILLLTFGVLTGLLWGGTRLIQGALYENVEADLNWRAPAAAGAITAFLGLWALFNYMAADPGQTDLPFDTIFNFTTEKIADRPLTKFTAVRGKAKEEYVFNDVGKPLPEYRDLANKKLWSARRGTDVDEVLVKDGDREVSYKAVVKTGPNDEKYVERYVEEGGRSYLDADSFGKIMTPRGGGSFVRVLLNVLHLGVWFGCLWALLRFQWPHALGLAVAMWLVMTFVAPYILVAGAKAKGPKPLPAQAAHTV